MTIRLKILAISTAMLAILSVALLSSLYLQNEVREEISSIVEYHVPLSAAVSEIDVATFEYELNLSRLLREEPITGPHLQAAEQRERRIIADIRANITKSAELIARGIGDKANDIGDRLALAHILGVFNIIRRDVAPFEALGREVLEAVDHGELDRARELMRGFARFEQSFGPDLAGIRRDIARLSEHSALETLGNQGHAGAMGLTAFVIATFLGLGVAGLLAHRMVGGLLQLVAGARAVEAGKLSESLPIRSQDEIGQLTRSFNHMVGELRAKERITATFGRYVDPKIVARLIDANQGIAELAERRIVTVFFSDIKGFSSLSEQLTATVIANFLNRYFGIAAETIRAHHGVVDKYIGDSVMAFWTHPFSTGDQHAADACLAALAFETALESLCADLPNVLGLRQQLPELIVRMGLATGEVVIGTIGAPASQTFTVIGDTVNLASRLEGIGKIYGTTITISEDTYRLAQSAIDAREIDSVIVAGKTEPVRIYEVMGRAGEIDEVRRELLHAYGEGLAAYRAMRWPAAEAAFRAALAAVGNDGPARVMLDRIAHFAAAPPAPDWDGVWRLSAK